MTKNKTLIVITGPTGSGKTSLALDVAEELSTEIISADSRQIYRHIPIGTAAPTPEQLARVKHYLVNELELDEYYSASKFEEDSLSILKGIWVRSDFAIVCGGSMMYIDALTKGMDDLPTVREDIRLETLEFYNEKGIEAVREELKRVDPIYYKEVDKCNHRRMIHALEIFRQCGIQYSSLRTGKIKERPFRILKFAIIPPREELFARINARVEDMIGAGLIEEAMDVYPMRNLNSLNTVGYKELFTAFDGKMSIPDAIARMAKNTRVYAKKQLTWMKKDSSLIPISPYMDMKNTIIQHI